MRVKWTPDREAELRRLVGEHHPEGDKALWEVVGRALGVTGKAAGIRWSHLKAVDLNLCTSPEYTEPDVRTSPLSSSPLTEQQALELFQVDAQKWEVQRLSHNTWQQGSMGPEGEVLTRDLYQTTLHLKRIETTDAALGRQVLEDIKQAAPPRGPFVLRKVKGQHLLEIDPVDLHFGKLGWDAETEAQNYDLSLATTGAEDAARDLFAKTASYDVAETVLVFGNDEQHTDNLRSETTSGTRVDSDSRFHKMFRRAVQWRCLLIRMALERSPIVRTLTVPGNHDRTGAFTAGEVVRAYFANEPRVVCDNEPPLRKYLRFGKTLLGYTHGSEERHSDLPLIMAQERPQDWAETLYRGWRLGHYHKRKQTKYVAGDSFNGVEVRILRSLSGTDQWHYSKGYVKERRGIEAFVHHKEEGEVGAFVSRLPES